ncbi:DNA polymerase III subunit delta [Ahrensia marina]|uniref:DNA polymerase III subunit delta n=1 Tax=Ahrensia marina TaxID=1514904 RepID=A0A0M9GP66_9HYPH|nr:DNA polymerase III subunit delta [Ahrensia marina]KPB02139.1 hypothetical protein SU32_05140 [Ahrensia marina]
MAQLKAGEVDRYLQKPDLSKTVHLVYGPDRGLVAERSKLLAQKSGVDLDDPFSTIRLDMDSLSADPDRLMNEAYTISMFGGSRLIWLRGVTNDPSLVKQLERLLNDPPQSCLCLLEAGDLKKGSKIRDLVERGKSGQAIPCYSDSSRNIASLVDEVLQANNLTIGLDARQFLLSQLGADRMASRAELDKLCLYAYGKSEIHLEDIQAVLGDASAISFDAVTDAVLTGNLKQFDLALTKFSSSGGSNFQLFAAMMRQFQMLDKMRSEMDASGKSASVVVASARPPVFFARKAATEAALNKWTSKAIRAAHDRLQTALLESRKNSQIDINIAHIALLGLTVQSARRR